MKCYIILGKKNQPNNQTGKALYNREWATKSVFSFTCRGILDIKRTQLSTEGSRLYSLTLIDAKANIHLPTAEPSCKAAGHDPASHWTSCISSCPLISSLNKTWRHFLFLQNPHPRHQWSSTTLLYNLIPSGRFYLLRVQKSSHGVHRSLLPKPPVLPQLFRIILEKLL